MTDFFVSILGPKLLHEGKEVDTKAVVEGKDVVAVYHSAHWCPPCRHFTPLFIEAYKEVQKKGGKSLATIFVTADRDENSFKEYFGEMPWHAVPFSATDFTGFKGKSAKHLNVNGIPSLTFFDAGGKIIEKEGVPLVMEHKANFMTMLDPEEKKKVVKKNMEALFAAMDLNKDNFVSPEELKQCFEAIGAPPQITDKEVKALMTRDADGDGKLSKNEFCVDSYSVAGRSAGWLATAITKNIEEAKKKAEAKAQLDKLKGSDFFKALLGDKLLFKSGEVDTKSVVDGKDYIGVYMSAHWCPPCRRFTPKLAETFAMIESKGDKKFSVVFCSCDRSEDAFKEYYGQQPWHAVPYSAKEFRGFESKAAAYLDCQGIPMLAIFDGKGNLITKEAVGNVSSHGAEFLGKL
eukprot:CAMPEP_0114516042 /NCGR_PEP_ID=MMETSP0109-20121206/17103_1 /TAXON_ID=29199 /ORGANISM="Chlorarachnion reptans, Strain CCCM449" /LENGTH=404 /DNA_ID=CAMNT_0001696377 /DNA_START=23 /DNA_END=1237 /DNA_ORIENTATION=-